MYDVNSRKKILKENKGVFIMERDLKLTNFYTVALYMCNINI